jgi:hypothetical protein
MLILNAKKHDLLHLLKKIARIFIRYGNVSFSKNKVMSNSV